MSLDAGKVAEIVDNLDVVVFPQANPDGRHHSMTVDPMWRKNRRPAGHGDPHCTVGGGNGPGVDINRNYDFMWDFPTLFSPQAPVQTSIDPCKETYRGPSRGVRAGDRQRGLAVGPRAERRATSSTSTPSVRTSSTTGATTTTRRPSRR